jgi:hypothetical protein
MCGVAGQFDLVWFSFPFADPPSLPVDAQHAELVDKFLRSARRVLSESGEVAVSLIVSQRGNAQFDRWSVASSACTNDLRLVGIYPFEQRHFAGYNPCTSQGPPFDLHRPVTYVFGQENVEAASSNKMYVRLLPASVKDTRPIRAFICVETHILAAILREGFSTRSRPNMAISTTFVGARAAFSRRYPSQAGVI